MADQVAVVPPADNRLEYKLHILEKHNYIIWKQHTLNILEAKDLLEVVTNPNVQDATRERQARALLTSALNDDNQMKVINCATARTIWTRLESIFENKTSFEKQNLIGKLHNYRIKSLNQISQGISEMESMAAKLNLLDETVLQESLMSAILRSLPSSLKTFVTVWKGTASAERTIDNLLSRLMSEVEDSKEPDERALFGGKNPGKPQFGKPSASKLGFRKQRFNKPKPSSGERDKKVTGKCQFCDKPGHWKRDCRQFKNQQQKSGGSSQIKPGNQRERPNGSNMGPLSLDFTALTASTGVMSTWVADSGALVHITSNIEWMTDYKEFEEEVHIGLGNQDRMQAVGSGTIRTMSGVLNNVHYVPEASNNLFSESSAAMKGVKIITDHEKKIFKIRNKKLFEATLCNGVYVINLEIKVKPQPRALKAASIDEWHRRFGHINKDTIERMADLKVVDGLDIATGSGPGQCQDCIMGKCHKVSHPSRTTERARNPGQSLHFDTVGPFQEESLGGAKYFVLCKDEFSSYRIIKFVSVKSDIADEVKACISQTQFDTGIKVLQITCDNGTEFINESLKGFLRERGINLKTTVPYTPQQNGFIERDNRTIIETGKTMLLEAKLPRELWAEAMSTAVYVLNRSINSKSDVTPHELWTGRRPNVRNLRIFGQEAITMIPAGQRSKLDAKGEKLVFIGYTDRANTFRFFDKENFSTKIKCDANFINSDPEGRSSDIVADEISPSSSSVIEEIAEVKQDSRPPEGLPGKSSKQLQPSSPKREAKGETNNDELNAPKIEECKPEEVEDDVILVQKKSSCAMIPKNLMIHKKPPEVLESRLRDKSNRPIYHATYQQ